MTMKSHTDLPQSITLAEFLPHESADQTWERIAIAGANLDVPDELQYRHNGNMPFSIYSGIGLPCWSLTALLDVLPPGKALIHDKGNLGYKCICKNVDTNFHSNPIDACYEMIVKLHDKKFL